MVLIRDKHQEKSAEAKPAALSTIKGLMYTLHSTSVHKIAMVPKRVWFLLQFYIMLVNPWLKTNKQNEVFYPSMMKYEWNFWGTNTKKHGFI